MAADDDDEKQQPAFRLLDVARYLVASVVTVLVIAVIVNAIKVVLRPESLAFYVQRGSVFVRRTKQPPMLLLDLSVMANNPKGRARIYYSNFTAYLFNKNTPATSPNPEEDSLVYFDLPDDFVMPQGRVESNVQVNETRDVSIAASPFDMLYNKKDAIIDGVTMRLEGSVVTEIRSDYNTTPHWSTYYCGPLILGGNPDDEASQNIPDILCKETQRT